MNLTNELSSLLDAGIRRIGEVTILTACRSANYVLCHHLDHKKALNPEFGNFEVHTTPDSAREISTWSEDGKYRFAKAMTNLRSGWILLLDDVAQVRQALDLIYPASLGLAVARSRGNLAVEHLRSKLNRQTGMYRFARNISDHGAQALVRAICGPAHQCARKILWQIDERTPLEESEASLYNGIPSGMDEDQAIPLLCREACNHFVAECRKAAKAEYDAANPPSS